MRVSGRVPRKDQKIDIHAQMEANAARQRVLHAASAAAPPSSPSALEGAYELLEVDVDKPVKKPQQIETLLTSRVAWGDVAPLVFFGTSDSTLHCYVPSTGSSSASSSFTAATGGSTSVGQLTYLRWHSSYKKAYHACAQFLDSWGIYLTLYDAKLALYALPLQSNPQIDGSGNASSSIMKGIGIGGGNSNSTSSRDKMLVVDETKQTTLFAAHEGAKVVCSISKQHTLRVYDWTVNRTLQLRAQHELPLLLQSLEGNGSALLPVQKMIVMGESHLFLQLKNGWCVLNVDSGRLIDVSARDATTALSVDAVTCAVAVPSRQTGLHHHSHQLRDIFLAGKHSAAIVALTVDNEDEEEASILDDKMRSNPQNVSDDRVRVKVERVLEYNVAPRAAFYHHPLLLLDQHDKLAVHNIGSMQLLESIPTKALYGASAATSIEKLASRSSESQRFALTADLPASLFTVTAPFDVQLLKMKPIELLVKQAQALGRLKDAVALCKLCPEDCSLNDDDLQALFAQYAFELFSSGQYRRAMSLFLESKMEVLDVLLALYPRDLLPRSAGSGNGAARLSAANTAAAKAKGARGELKGDALVESLLALILLLRHRRDSLVNHHTTTTNEPSFHTSQKQQPSDKKLEIIDTVLLKCLVLICEKDEHAQLAKKELMELVVEKNYCEMGEAEIFLRSHRQFRALLAFYATRKEHRKALELLEDLERNATATASQSSPLIVPGEEALQTSEAYMELIKEYLQRLGQSKAELVFEFSRRVIAVKPALGLSIFTERKVREQKEDIDPSLVLNHLKTCDVQAIAAVVTTTTDSAEPALSTATREVALPLIDPRFLAIEYLTQVIFDGKTAIASRLHDEVVYLLLDAISTEPQTSSSRSSSSNNGNHRLTSRVSSQRGLVGTLRKKLIVFLEAESSAYHPERMLSRTPLDMVDERAALLSKLGRHHEVLQLYAIDLKDASLAEGYCNRCYDAKLADSSIYSALLRLYLRPQPSQLAAMGSPTPKATSSPAPPLVWQQRSTSSSSSTGFLSSEAVAAAVSILNKYPERIDVPTALDLLPPDVPVSSLAFFFRRVLERQVERYRNGQVKKQLSKMENFKVREALSTKRKGCVTVWSSQCCQVCGKKLGTGTFVRLPGGTLLHYACQPNSS